MNVGASLDGHSSLMHGVAMQHASVKDLLTSGQAAAVLHKSQRTITRWAVSGELPSIGRIPVGNGGVFVFDREVIEQKAIDLEFGPEPTGQLDLDPERKAS